MFNIFSLHASYSLWLNSSQFPLRLEFNIEFVCSHCGKEFNQFRPRSLSSGGSKFLLPSKDINSSNLKLNMLNNLVNVSHSFVLNKAEKGFLSSFLID